IVIKVNGKTTVDIVDERYRRGHLALQAWAIGTVVYFRKIEIKELPPTGSGPAQPRARVAENSVPVSILVFSRDGTSVAIGSDKTVTIRHVDDFRPSKFPLATIRLEHPMKAALFSPAAGLQGLFGTATQDGTLKFWNLAGKKLGDHEMQS